MSNDLKPVRCGCGGEAKVVKALCNDKKGKPIVVGYSVTCEICGTRTRPVSAGAIAVAVWNKAMGADKVDELMEHIWREKLDTREKIADLVERMLR